MSAFDQNLRRAQARQRRFYLTAFCVLVVAVVGVVMGLLYASGTRVVVQPDDAAVDATVTVFEGPAISVDRVIYGIFRTPTIKVGSPGFREARYQIQPDEQGRRITVTLAPLPGRIIATAEPPHNNTRWHTDGHPASISNAIDMEVEAGVHELEIDNRWHPLASRAVTVKRGETVELEVMLQPLAGRFELASEPDGATVSIDGEKIGQTPLTRAMSGGRYDLVIARDGYIAVNETMEVTRDAPIVTRHYRLKPVTATLIVTVTPKGGDLLLDGRRIKPQRGYELATNRTHSVTYLRKGWRGAKETVRLAPGETRRLSLSLEREFGSVEIHSQSDVAIFIDGKRVGERDVTLSLPALAHRVELRKPGYRTIERTITPTAGRTTVLREQLLPELAARLAETPRVYRNMAGITLKLFEPQGDFMMGAPRGQEGQRANEFEKQVTLTRRFYASAHEITNAQFRQFQPGHGGPDNQPATSISWNESAAFCNWLSEREKLTPFYSITARRTVVADPTADGYRLLSEAEWEWLARRAGKSKQTIFSWGDASVVPKEAGNIADEAAKGLVRYFVPNYRDGHAMIAPVGSYPAEPSGLYDMTGNVSEWVHDYYSLTPPLKGEVFADPLGPSNGDSHVIKGSSWRSGTRTALRASFRDGLTEVRDDVGLRIGRYLYGAE